MAWRAELIHRHWYCICGNFMPQIFSKYLYDQWYDSLSNEDKQLLTEYKRKEREKNDIELQECIRRIAVLSAICKSLPKGPWFNKI